MGNHSYHLFTTFAMPHLWVPTRKSHLLEAEGKKFAAHFFWCGRLAHFVSLCRRKALMPQPCVLLSHPFWEALLTASPQPFQRLQSAATTLCWWKTPQTALCMVLIHCLWVLCLIYSPDCKQKQWFRARKKSLNWMIMENRSCVN